MALMLKELEHKNQELKEKLLTLEETNNSLLQKLVAAQNQADEDVRRAEQQILATKEQENVQHAKQLARLMDELHKSERSLEKQGDTRRELEECKDHLAKKEQQMLEERSDKRATEEAAAVTKMHTDSVYQKLNKLENFLGSLKISDPLNRGGDHTMKMTKLDAFSCAACTYGGGDWAWKCTFTPCPDALHAWCINRTQKGPRGT